jgi:hypothetical protein
MTGYLQAFYLRKQDFGPDYHDHGVLFCWETASLASRHDHPPIQRFARAADFPEIDLHDVRHSYATAGRNAKIDWKALS